ncbi:DEAD/DEAH box helicase [Corynebacterium kutscheri]|uniref:ATP-dependent DNA helicase n=1 Tax=Corynebacterium kutscheri TaxID=35755 RepID=A0AB38VYB9_9CORY|nr:RNA helicase [Corynebacterium kutscheri]VEH08483.1 ATP-dependent DNA helicase [Corynebacterium kutscheri]
MTVEPIIIEGVDISNCPHLQNFRSTLGFKLDAFQLQGCVSVERGRGVLVCAPTGAGKTIVGEFAVSLALSKGNKCFYTTPIKALSNQKYHDLIAVYGFDRVGLLTGDVSINAAADVVVMTTEVLRNMIYADSPTLDRLSHVVMDEIHFLADRSRGAVWEEVILNLDESVSVVGLSATVSNSEEFGRWLSTVRGDTDVVVTDRRPVPLDQWMLVGRRMHELFDAVGSTDVNPRLSAHIDRIEGAQPREGSHQGFGIQRSGRPRQQDKYRPISRPEMIELLAEHTMLPAIDFIFSRAGCDAALYQCLNSQLVLTTEQESTTIAEIIEAGIVDIPEEDLKLLGYRQWRQALMRGFATHHAGMLPAFRHIVEKLFTLGLLRIVFATETLALGINMPARTVVLEKLVKYNGEAHVALTPGQYTQLTGRAGRRGIDTIGNAVVLWAPATDPEAVAGLASTRTYPLISTFAPGYNMSVNLLKTIGFSSAHRMLEKSFAQFQADGSIVDEVREIERAEAKEKELTAQLNQLIGSDEAVAEFLDYVQLRRELSQAEKKLRKHLIEEREIEVRRVLSKLQLGDVVALPGKKRPLLAVVVQPADNAHTPKPWFIMESGWSGRITSDALGIAPIVVGHMRLPRKVIASPRRNTRVVSELFQRNNFARPKRMRHQPRVRPTKAITALREQLRAHPAHHWPGREELARVGEKLVRQRAITYALREKISAATDTLGRTFDRILALLAEMDYVEYTAESIPRITNEGERLALIHSECDLLVAQCLKRGIWDNLDPAELAGVASMCTFENRKETKGTASGATDNMLTAMNNTMRIWEEISVDEKRHRLPITPYPEAGFALAIHQWTAGAPLGYCLAAAAQSGAELTPGDFVRQCLQVIDLLEQIRKTAYTKDTAHNARRAIDAIKRGVVAVGY